MEMNLLLFLISRSCWQRQNNLCEYANQQLVDPGSSFRDHLPAPIPSLHGAAVAKQGASGKSFTCFPVAMTPAPSLAAAAAAACLRHCSYRYQTAYHLQRF